MEFEPRIYCIEGIHDWGDSSVEPSIEPMLQLLQRLGYWPRYEHRRCATRDEVMWYLSNEWRKCASGSILYFCTHGSHKQVSLAHDWLMLDDLGANLESGCKCEGCAVHFGGCRTFPEKQEERDLIVKGFMRVTDATVVSGFTNKSGWIDLPGCEAKDAAPTLLLELAYFAELSYLIAKGVRQKKKWPRLDDLEKKLNKIDERSGFKLYRREEAKAP